MLLGLLMMSVCREKVYTLIRLTKNITNTSTIQLHYTER